MGKPERRKHLEEQSIVGLTVSEWDILKGNGRTSVVFI